MIQGQEDGWVLGVGGKKKYEKVGFYNKCVVLDVGHFHL